MQVRAVHVVVRRAILLRHVHQWGVPDALARAVPPQDDRLGAHGDRVERGARAPPSQQARRVGREVDARADLPDGGRGFEERHLVPGLAEAVRGCEPAHAATDNEDVELVGRFSAIVEGGVDGDAFGVRCGVGRRQGMGVAWCRGHGERVLGIR